MRQRSGEDAHRQRSRRSRQLDLALPGGLLGGSPGGLRGLKLGPRLFEGQGERNFPDVLQEEVHFTLAEGVRLCRIDHDDAGAAIVTVKRDRHAGTDAERASPLAPRAEHGLVVRLAHDERLSRAYGASGGAAPFRNAFRPTQV